MKNGGANILRSNGFTIIEVMVDMVIIGLVAAAVLTAYSAGFKAMELAKSKIAAVALANEKMENLRNMPYDRLATQGGAIYPPGGILDNEEVNRRGVIFNVATSIIYIDDQFDGIIPFDANPSDYKKVEITVSKKGGLGFLSRLTTNFSAKAAETESNSGIIKLCVVDAAGLPIPEANITIYNPDPLVNISEKTGIDGCIMVPNLPPESHNNYHLTATKLGGDPYSTDMTFPRTDQNFHALFPDVNVMVQQVTIQTMVIDRVGILDLTVINEQNQPIVNQIIHIASVKEKYFNPHTPFFEIDASTDGAGRVVLPDLSFGDYRITIPNFNVLSTFPYSPVYVKPAETTMVKIIATAENGYPSIVSVNPATAKVGQILKITLNGTDFSNGVQVKFSNGINEISGIVNSSDQSTIDATFDLTGVINGFWDIIITNSDGRSVKQERGIEIRNE